MYSEYSKNKWIDHKLIFVEKLYNIPKISAPNKRNFKENTRIK